jgi:hypothetical protein
MEDGQIWKPLTVKEAAESLQISEDAVRKRMQRGTLRHDKTLDGHVYVYLDSEKEGPESDEQKALHYIDKLYSSWQSVSTSVKRMDLAVVLISLLLLVLSGSQDSGKQANLTFSGIGLKIPFVVLLIAGAVGLVVLISISQRLTRQRGLLEEKIVDLYKRIGVDESDLVAETAGTKAGLFEAGNLVDTFTETFKGGSWFAAAGVYIILPAAGQAAAITKVAELLQKQGYGWVGGLTYLIVAATCAVYYWDAKEEMKGTADKIGTIALLVFFAFMGAGVGSVVAGG